MSSLEDRDPYALFAEWLEEAGTTEPNDPNAMALATCTPEGRPSLRMVLLKGVIAQAGAEGGFIFYTNLESRKGGELLANPHAALCFHWKSLRRQVRVEGPVVAVSDAEADAYFASRHRDSRIGAWASMQSRPLQGRFELERRVAQFAARYAVGAVPRPPHWSGFRVVPEVIEFWHDRPFRLHDRVVYRSEGSGWTHSRLYP
ncbi:pyridoxamine 5'-phosphate oxidase [Rhodospirillum rubrum]|uniref:pyridoxamine 5'-phosphate oxidase n=1 Tax=Rhodospirillum rubrum TaxID=1085 RepID=UPI0019072F6B|nr:pyridoxamine 5'-phosphate oxidase [Rhodospirillum rubrum]MBK1665317.1 pyridoxamine 5'-phosphate oxidase [Rhodospirillum rubrum]MBK1676505.1 pyridoxamine 5'-phosphate oxidase [Rhodospirillum rubrum]